MPIQILGLKDKQKPYAKKLSFTGHEVKINRKNWDGVQFLKVCRICTLSYHTCL